MLLVSIVLFEPSAFMIRIWPKDPLSVRRPAWRVVPGVGQVGDGFVGEVQETQVKTQPRAVYELSAVRREAGEARVYLARSAEGELGVIARPG